MQPIRLVIPGDYWDSQIYRGRLYLTSMDGGTSVYDWDHAVELMIHQDSDRLTVTCAFSRGDYLYHPEWSLVFRDPEIGTVLREKFSALAITPLDMPSSVLAESLLGSADSIGGLADDTAVYRNQIYAATEAGLLRANIRQARSKRNRSGIGRPETIWDGAALSLAVRSGGDLAIAAGAEGLFELSDLFSEPLTDPTSVSARHTTFANYAFASIYGSSDNSGGYLAAYAWAHQNNDSRLTRQYVKTFNDSEIFQSFHGTSWANQEKIYLCEQGKLLAVKYVQGNVVPDKHRGDPFQIIGSLDVPTANHRILAGGVAFFGTVIEHDTGLIVVRSDNSIFEISGPVTRWRVFPRSNRYENHLHVIFEDRLEIFSFNHDYMVEQDTKIAGIEYRSERQRNSGGNFRPFISTPVI
jgi:hypothetical protein